MNLIQLSEKSREAFIKLTGAQHLVALAASGQAGWLMIYERYDAEFIKEHADTNFKNYLAECEIANDLAADALQTAIAAAKANR